MKIKSFVKQRAVAMLELIIVVVVIAILSGWYFSKGGNSAQEAASQYQHSMERSNNTACLASRTGLKTSIQLWQMQNPGKPVNAENLSAANINTKVCPEQGQISITSSGDLVCSKHPN